MRLPCALVLFALLASPAHAQETSPLDAPAPPPPPFVEDTPLPQEQSEPQVTIIERRGETVEEYRIAGQLYMIRVVPKNGPPYYLVDADGDGNLESTMNELDPRIMIPSWVILRW